jgi:hypothetical protein
MAELLCCDADNRKAKISNNKIEKNSDHGGLMVSLRERLTHLVDLSLPGFKKTVPPGTVYQLAFDNRPASVWFAEFIQQVEIAIGKKYLPIYRMADGEFIFCVGWKPELPPEGSSLWIKSRCVIKNTIKTLLRRIGIKSRAVRTVWGEYYTAEERSKLIRYFIDCLKNIAEHGYLALHFTRTRDRFSEQYVESMCNWFDSNNIQITPQNYIPFYFVYALLCGPERFKLFTNRRILVITSASEGKRLRISQALTHLGARKVDYVAISPDKSLMDRLDLSTLSELPDVVLVAAGIGSANVLCQLAPLQTVCIDAGICVEALADPSLRNRVFMIPDDEAEHPICS